MVCGFVPDADPLPISRQRICIAMFALVLYLFSFYFIGRRGVSFGAPICCEICIDGLYGDDICGQNVQEFCKLK